MPEVWIRNKGVLEEPPVYKSGFMNFIHKNPLGVFLNRVLISHPLFSVLLGAPEYRGKSIKKIIPFIEEYGINPEEFEKKVEDFTCFNDFFTRKLKPFARPVDQDPLSIISPADGQVSITLDLNKDTVFNVKGDDFNLYTLTGDAALAARFEGGSLAVVYLAPVDYHRFHFPFDCSYESFKTIGKKLFSVSPIALEAGFRPFDVNVRTVCVMKNSHIGEFLISEIGAPYVGKIVQTSEVKGSKVKGEEKGYFGLGASSIILAFKKGAVKFDQDILDYNGRGIPVKVLMGMKLATIVKG